MTRDGAKAAGISLILCLRFDDRARFEDFMQCKQALLARPEVIQCMEVSGNFHFMAEVAVPDLGAYQALLESLTTQFGTLLAHHEANFICRRYEREDDSRTHCLWVPCADGRQRVDCDQIDLVIAEGDYVRVKSGKGEWLLHATLTSIARQLESDFVQLSRSVLVRCGFISRLIHHGRHWLAQLSDGSQHRIAKARAASVLALLRTDSANELHRSSNIVPSHETPLRITEKAVR